MAILDRKKDYGLPSASEYAGELKKGTGAKKADKIVGSEHDDRD